MRNTNRSLCPFSGTNLEVELITTRVHQRISGADSKANEIALSQYSCFQNSRSSRVFDSSIIRDLMHAQNSATNSGRMPADAGFASFFSPYALTRAFQEWSGKRKQENAHGSHEEWFLLRATLHPKVSQHGNFFFRFSFGR
jgi:hypothetical protein